MFVTDRTTKVLLTAQVNGYLSGMDQAARKTKDVTQAAMSQKDALKSLGQTATVALGAIGLAAAGAATLAIAKFAQFDQAMSYVDAATHETAANMDLLRNAAMDAGARTVFSATEAANAIEELGKAGVSTKDILAGGLNGALDLAAAGGLGVADAAEIAATALKVFSLSGRDMSHVADLLAAGAGKAMGSVQDLSVALTYVGPVAAGMGVSIDETVGTLAAFASQGILADQAGTGLRGMLSSLTSPSNVAKNELDSLGVTLYDGQGKFLGLANMAGELEKAYGSMTDQQKDTSLGLIFGNQQITAARVLLKEGEKGVRDWTKATNDQGYAADTAARRLNNLKGDIEQLGGAFDTALIKSGSAANEVLRSLVQSATDAVTAFADAPAWVQATTMAVTVLTAVIVLLAGGLVFLIPKIYETGAALTVLSTSQIPGVAVAATGLLAATRGLMVGLSGLARFLTSKWGFAFGLAALSVAALVHTMHSGAPSSEELANALAKAASAAELLKSASKQDAASKFFWGDYADSLKDLPGLLDKINNDGWDWANLSFKDQGSKAALDALGNSLGELARTDLPAAQKQFNRLADENKLTRAQQIKLLDTMPDLRAALVEQATKLGLTATNTNLLKIATGNGIKVTATAATAYSDAADKAKGLDDQITNLMDTINAANGVGQDAVSTNASYRQSLDDARAAVDKYIAAHGKSVGALDESTAAGSANAAMLAGLASDAQTAAKAQFDLDGRTTDYVSRLESGRKAIYDTALALTGNADAAQALTDKIFAMPDQKEIQILADTARAKTALDDFITSITSRRPVMYIEGRVVATGQPQFRAGGGTVTGIGTSKSDSNMAFLSKGEEVTQEPYASRFRPQLKLMNQGIIPRFAGGGTNGAPMYAPPTYNTYMQAAPVTQITREQGGPMRLDRADLDYLGRVIDGLSRNRRRQQGALA